MCKYLRNANYLDGNGHVKNDKDISPRLLNRIRNTSNLKPSVSTAERAQRFAHGHKTLGEMIDACQAGEVLAYFGALPQSAIDLNMLRNFLVEHESDYTKDGGKFDSLFTKAICIYDLLRYGPKADWQGL